MDTKFLKRYIEECPLTDFTDNGNVNERLLQLDEYLEKFTSYLYNNEPKLTQHFWEEYFASSQVLILQNSAFLRHALLFFDVVVGCFNFITPKYINGRKASKTAEMLSVQLQNTFSLYKSLLTLAMNGCFHSVISEYRTLYESFVITKYLLLHPDLIPIYKEHSEFLVLHINKMANNNTPEQEKKYDDFINKYGKDFADNLGWTKSVITEPKDRKLITLVNECQLEPFFGPLYKVACNYVHPSSLASTSRISPDFIKPFLQVPMHIICYEICDYIIECKVVKKEAVIIKNMIEFLFDDITKDFSNVKQII